MKLKNTDTAPCFLCGKRLRWFQEKVDIVMGVPKRHEHMHKKCEDKLN